MEALNLEMIVFLICTLGFGSSLIHYTAYAKSRAKIAIRKDLKKEL